MEEYTLDRLVWMNQSVFSHALGLKKEADLLMRHGRYPHVISLCILLKEELAKCQFLRRLIVAKHFEETLSPNELMEGHFTHQDAHKLIQLHLLGIDFLSLEEMNRELDFIETGFYETLRENSIYTCFNFSKGFGSPVNIFTKEIAIEHLRECKSLLEINFIDNYSHKRLVYNPKQSRKRRMFKAIVRNRRRVIKKYFKQIASGQTSSKPGGKKFDHTPASVFESTLSTKKFYEAFDLVLKNARYLIDTAILLRESLGTSTAAYFLSAAYEELGRVPLVYQLGISYQLKNPLPWNMFLENFFNHQAKYVRALNFEKEMGINSFHNADAISEAQALFWLRNASVYTSLNMFFLNPRNFINLDDEIFVAAGNRWSAMNSYFSRITELNFLERIGKDPSLVTPKPVQDNFLLTDKQKRMRIYQPIRDLK